MTIGITGFGAYLPRLRLNRKEVVEANAWFAPQLQRKGKGQRSMSNWDEDAVTLAVAACRNALPESVDRNGIARLQLVSDSLPFAERLNAGVVAGALRLPQAVYANDLCGAQSAAVSAISQLVNAARAAEASILVAASNRRTRAASPAELDYGDGSAAVTLGSDKVLAEVLSTSVLTADFVDRFRLQGEDIDYYWEERWVRDEGIGKLGTRAVSQALDNAGLAPASIDHFIFPTVFKGADAQLAQKCGIAEAAVVDNFAAQVGDTGSAHALLMLNAVLERAQAGQTILVCQFGSGVSCALLRVTEQIDGFKPVKTLAEQLAAGWEENNYTRYLAYKGQLKLERGMRGEQDKKTALSTSWRHHDSLLGFVAGRCTESGNVHFPPSRISYTPGKPAQDTQEPYPLADRKGRILSWSAEYLSSYMAPPHQYGQVDFEGGGRLLMEFTDVRPGDIESGGEVEMVFRIKDVDELRGYKRYFWKAKPTTYPAPGRIERG
ncbi:3-oxoacyl-[acyl-carrier-protein] synthase III C-terminal domain-containing protein [Haliea sp. E1-2-M8]|uniref:3-oxoacyl-[acyl-carrier-protein] synthase III C-terminal domain-containing protein n=1 Tax=Haliea sp. E1-2-M8 TaxID=3064706 RepID=UPI00271E25EB|nr:3-oxoacyl-[acyl-carrier-protein] synthase III C-terminal domain-containing protein [Haliea sp. E1-2-M8]MDO8864104.1 3-oxoacyl-[acyl-carrier-protein] synthase III C-terminal domain-containing protein [Haliea sp. E1-2-M8]